MSQANFIEKATCQNKSLFLEAPPRFELGVKVLQTSALPLGYGALCFFREKDASFCVFFLCGAEDEIRTRDFHLGKVTLYH